MTVHNSTDALAAEMMSIGVAARDAARAMREASDETKTKALHVAAAAIRQRAAEILDANRGDIEAAKAANMPANMIDRLALNDARIEAMAQGIETVAALPDPVGREMARWSRPNGLDIARVATPIGVIGIIYESRPNVTADAGALALKSGNVAILRGGSDSIRSSRAIQKAMAEGLKAAGLPQTAIQVVASTDRAAVGMMLEGLNGAIDLIIPRGGKGLTGRVINEARVPVLAHLEWHLPCLYPRPGRTRQGAQHCLERQDAADIGLRRRRNPVGRSRGAAIAWREGAGRPGQGRLRDPRR